MDEKTYANVVERITAQGYDVSKIQKIPQR
jgi:hypothetical protein